MIGCPIFMMIDPTYFGCFDDHAQCSAMLSIHSCALVENAEQAWSLHTTKPTKQYSRPKILLFIFGCDILENFPEMFAVMQGKCFLAQPMGPFRLSWFCLPKV